MCVNVYAFCLFTDILFKFTQVFILFIFREFDQDPCLGDPEIPRSGPQGRLVQAYPDGTLLIELSRPANGPFGFVISRGKGRPGSGSVSHCSLA